MRRVAVDGFLEPLRKAPKRLDFATKGTTQPEHGDRVELGFVRLDDGIDEVSGADIDRQQVRSKDVDLLKHGVQGIANATRHVAGGGRLGLRDHMSL